MKAKKLMPKTFLFFLILTSKKKWQAVTVTPEESKIIVFKRGTLKGSIIISSKKNGGQEDPKSSAGDQHIWKKAQKKLPKKQTSDKINNSMPLWRNFLKEMVWIPEKPSFIISRHQKNIVPKKTKKAINKIFLFLKCHQKTLPEVNKKAAILPVKGQKLKDGTFKIWKDRTQL